MASLHRGGSYKRDTLSGGATMGHLGDRVPASHTWAAHSCWEDLFLVRFPQLRVSSSNLLGITDLVLPHRLSPSKNAAGGELPLILGSRWILKSHEGTLTLGNISDSLCQVCFKFLSINYYDLLSTGSKGHSTLILQICQFLYYLFTISSKPFVSALCLSPPFPTSIFPR